MTNEEIIKSLEICCGCAPKDECDCLFCHYVDSDYLKKCTAQLANDVLDLINRQKVEIDKLQEELADARYLNTVAESDGIKEFAERLKEIVQFADDTYECWEIEGYIDDLVKEMTEAK